MKSRFLCTLLLLFAFTTVIFAQSSGNTLTIKGKVIDDQTNVPLSYSTISLYSQTDKKLITGTITDDAGAFVLEAQAGAYFIRIEFLAYQAQEVLNIVLTNAPIDLGTIKLQAEAATLNEVVVQAEKSSMQFALDKKIFNVGKDLGNSGGNAADILDNIPSVSVDVEGNVSMRGSGNVRILIDGKPSGLMSFKGADGLRQLMGNQIERVEVITNPSARYEAEGMAGIINIVLKKEHSQGLNGAFDVTAGYPDNYSAGFNLNYRKEKLNFFLNSGISYRNSPGKNYLYQEVYGPDTTFITNQTTDRNQVQLSENIRLGADYFFNANNILTSSFSYNHSNGKHISTIEYRDYLFSLDNPESITTRTQDEVEIEPNMEYVLNYKRSFKGEGHELTAEARYQDNWENSDQDFVERFFTPDYSPSGQADFLQRSDNDETEKQWLFQVDYVYPFAKEGKFEAGLRSNFREMTNDYLVEEFIGDHWESLEGLSNNFNYNENIHAAYAIFGNKKGRFSYQAGVRAELSDITTLLLQTNQRNTKNYVNFFPSLHLTYDLPRENALQVSYSRRVRRPRYRDLNPFFTFTDNRNFFSGNPDLQPEFTDSYEISHIKYMDQASITTSIYYRYTTGEIERIRRVDENGYSTTRPENLSTENAYGAEFTASYTPYKWWKLDGNLNFFRAITDGANLDASFKSDTYSWLGRLTSRFTVWGNTDFQLRGNYDAPRKTTQGTRKAGYFLDFAISRDILHDNATITFNVTDVFNSRRWRSITQGANFYSEGDFQWRQRQINLSINYRLRQNKQREEGRKSGQEGGEGGDF